MQTKTEYCKTKLYNIFIDVYVVVLFHGSFKGNVNKGEYDPSECMFGPFVTNTEHCLPCYYCKPP